MSKMATPFQDPTLIGTMNWDGGELTQVETGLQATGCPEVVRAPSVAEL